MASLGCTLRCWKLTCKDESLPVHMLGGYHEQLEYATPKIDWLTALGLPWERYTVRRLVVHPSGQRSSVRRGTPLFSPARIT